MQIFIPYAENRREMRAILMLGSVGTNLEEGKWL